MSSAKNRKSSVGRRIETVCHLVPRVVLSAPHIGAQGAAPSTATMRVRRRLEEARQARNALKAAEQGEPGDLSASTSNLVSRCESGVVTHSHVVSPPHASRQAGALQPLSSGDLAPVSPSASAAYSPTTKRVLLELQEHATVTKTGDGGLCTSSGAGYVKSIAAPVDIGALPSLRPHQLVDAVACTGALHLCATSDHWVRVHDAKEENLRLRTTQRSVGDGILTQLHQARDRHAGAAGVSGRHAEVTQRRLALMENRFLGQYESFLLHTNQREAAKHCHESRLRNARARAWLPQAVHALVAQMLLFQVKVARAKAVLRRHFVQRSLAYLRRKHAQQARRDLVRAREEGMTEPPSIEAVRAVPAMSRLPEALLLLLPPLMQKRCYLGGEFVAYAGEPCDTCMLLDSGGVNATGAGVPVLAAASRNTALTIAQMPQTDLRDAVPVVERGATALQIRRRWAAVCGSALLTPEPHELTLRAGAAEGAAVWVLSHQLFTDTCTRFFADRANMLRQHHLASQRRSTSKAPDEGFGAPKDRSGGKADGDAGGTLDAATVRQLESIGAARDWQLRCVDGRRELNMLRYRTLSPAAVRKASTLFMHWSPAGVDALIRRAKPVVHRRDDVVVEGGHYGHRLLVVVAGRLEVLVDGKRVELVREGACIGDVAAATGHREPRVSVRAVANSDVWEVDRRDVEAIAAREDPAVIMSIVVQALDEHGHERFGRHT